MSGKFPFFRFSFFFMGWLFGLVVFSLWETCCTIQHPSLLLLSLSWRLVRQSVRITLRAHANRREVLFFRNAYLMARTRITKHSSAFPRTKKERERELYMKWLNMVWTGIKKPFFAPLFDRQLSLWRKELGYKSKIYQKYFLESELL